MNAEAVAGFRRLSEHIVHSGHVWSAVVAEFEAPDGATFRRDIVRSPGAVAAVALLADRPTPTVSLVAQYRPAFERVLVEIPAGMRDVDGEADEDNARRELAEEVGLRPEELHLLAEIAPSVGMTDSTCAIFLATGCTEVGRSPHGPEEEQAEVFELPLVEAVQWVRSGRITDAKSVVGLLLAERWLDDR